MTDRTHKDFTPADIARIANTYHAWRGEREAGEYAEEAGFSASVDLGQIEDNGYVLTPGRYVGVSVDEEDQEPLGEKIDRLQREIREGFAQRKALQAKVMAALDGLRTGDG